jgi:hypothetical protein
MTPRPSIPVRVLRRLRASGPRRTLSHVGHLLGERFHDARLGIRTTGKVVSFETDRRPGFCKPYAPTAYRSFHAVMREVAVRPGRDVFVDYGAGKGRVVVLAAMYPFRRVIGVEISPELSAVARANVRRAARHLSCHDVEILTRDAADFGCPDEATLLHFFDPFAGAVLERVLEQIRASLESSPRPLTILYADPNEFVSLAAHCSWLRKRAEVPYPFSLGTEPIRESYYIYEAVQ